MGGDAVRRDKHVALYEALRAIAASNLEVIEPSVSYSTGVIYPVVLKAAAPYGISEAEALEELTRMGALETEPYDNIVVCPNCGSLRLFSKLRCPSCGSESLRKTLILVHVTCGGVNVVEESERAASCSKCGKPLAEARTIGTLYQCQSCGARFETPLSSWRCADCKAVFDYKQARYVTIPRYRVRRERLPDIAKQLLVSIVSEEIAASGLKVVSSAQVRGRSGYYHTVDIVASGGASTIYVDVVADSPRALGEALSSIAKTADLEGQHIVLLPRSLEKSAPSAAGSNVAFYESARDLREKVDQLLEKLKVRKKG